MDAFKTFISLLALVNPLGAIQTLPGTEVDSAYSASLAYEKEIATARAQSARNWKVDAHVERSGQGGATLQVEARDNDGRPMSGLKFHGRFERLITQMYFAGDPRSPKSGSASIAGARRQSRRANGIWCLKVSRRDSGCFCPRTACC